MFLINRTLRNMQSDRGYNMRRNIIGLLLFLFCGLCYAESHEEEIRTLLIESMQPKMQDDEFSPFKKDVYTLVAMKKMNSYEQEEEIWLGVWLRNNRTDYFQFTIYFIREGKIFHQENISGMNNDFELLFEYTGSILEKQIESFRLIPGVGTGFIYDFNRDGINDILAFAQGGTGKYYIIETINKDTKEFNYFLSIEKQNYEEECPFMFIEYQGKRGIKVHEDYKVKTENIDFYGDVIYETHQRWSFYTWDKKTGMYTREESITSEELEDVIGDPDFFLNDTPVKSVEIEEKTKNEEVATSDIGEESATNTYFASYLPVFGSVGIAIIVFFIVVSNLRKKKER